MLEQHKNIRQLGMKLGDFFNYLGLLVIGAIVLWAAAAEILHIINKAHVELKDILLMFIYLELGVMIGIYFRTHRLPVQFLIFIAITALSRHLVIDVQAVSDFYHLYLLLTISACILILSGALYVLSLTATKFGRPDDSLHEKEKDLLKRAQAVLDEVGSGKK